MHLATALGLFLGFWSILYLLDIYFRGRNFSRYISFVESTGLVISPFQVRWYTNRFQPWLVGLPLLQRPTVRRMLHWWFSVGVVCAVLSSVLMLAFLTQVLWRELSVSRLLASLLGNFWSIHPKRVNGNDQSGDLTPTPVMKEEDQHRRVGLVPIVPGVNVPWEHMPIFIVALVIAGVIHELGHAVAAVNENVGVNGFGVFLAAIYPGAFTEIDSVGLESITLFRKLKIYSAGIWHNFCLAFVAYVLLMTLPITLSPVYMSNKESNVVYGINYCKVYNEMSWYGCLSLIRKTNYGYCIPKTEVLHNKQERVSNVHGELHCCDDNSTQTHLCFYYKTGAASVSPADTLTGRSGVNDTLSRLTNPFEYACLPARYVTDHHVCNRSLACHHNGRGKGATGARTTCVYPALFNSTKLQRFFVANHSRPVLFIGFPDEVASLVAVSSYVPRFSTALAPVWLPPVIQLFLKYLLTFSLALGLLNAVPCYSLDGEFLTTVMVEALVVRHRKWSRRRKMVYKTLMHYGTMVLVGNVLVALWTFARPMLASVGVR